MYNIKDILKEIQNSNFLRECKIPLGYSQGLPVLSIVNDSLCVTIPYQKYKVTGEIDKTLVYATKYLVSFSLPGKNIVSFRDLEFEEAFQNIDYSRPIGYFRHEAIQHLDKKAYKQKRDELYSQYDKVINMLLLSEDYSEEDDKQMKELIQLLIEPCLKPIYKAIDEDFYNKYII